MWNECRCEDNRDNWKITFTNMQIYWITPWFAREYAGSKYFCSPENFWQFQKILNFFPEVICRVEMLKLGVKVINSDVLVIVWPLYFAVVISKPISHGLFPAGEFQVISGRPRLSIILIVCSIIIFTSKPII